MAEKSLRAFVMRHGDTDANDANIFRGMLDVPLNDEGKLDAHKAGEFLSRQTIDRVICSPLLRAVQTAKIVSGVLGGRYVEQCRCLFPWQVPEIMGKDRDEYKEELEHYIDHPTEVPENGESLHAFQERVGDFFEDQLKIQVVTLFITHTSDIVTLVDLIHGDTSGRPESGEVVGPGGVIAIYEDGDGYSTEVVLGEEKKPEYGS